MAALGKSLLILGLGLAAVGGLILLADKIPWLGKLPGDIHIRRGNFSFYLPITTCLILSALISLVVALFKRR